MEWGEHDLYDILQVRPEDGLDVLRANYRRLALENHPDKHPEHKEVYTKRFDLIANGFRVLSNPKLRALYDKVRARRQQVGDIVLERKRQVYQKTSDAYANLPRPPVPKGSGPAPAEKVAAMTPEEFAAQLAKRKGETITVARDKRLGKFDRDTFMNIFENEQLDTCSNGPQAPRALCPWEGTSATDGHLVAYNPTGSATAFASFDTAFQLGPRIEYKEMSVKERLAEYERLSSELNAKIPQNKVTDVIQSLQK